MKNDKTEKWYNLFNVYSATLGSQFNISPSIQRFDISIALAKSLFLFGHQYPNIKWISWLLRFFLFLMMLTHKLENDMFLQFTKGTWVSGGDHLSLLEGRKEQQMSYSPLVTTEHKIKSY